MTRILQVLPTAAPLMLLLLLGVLLQASLEGSWVVAFSISRQYQRAGLLSSTSSSSPSPTRLFAASSLDRRDFGRAVLLGTTTASGLSLLGGNPSVAGAKVYMDPAQYGDQELRVSAVDSIRESVRRAILEDPTTAPAFYQLALLDALSYDAATGDFGPDGSVMKILFATKEKDDYTDKLQKAALSLIAAEKRLRGKTAISLPDAIAIGGAEAIESVGGPVLTVQLGRADTPPGGRVSASLPLDLFSGNRSPSQIVQAFRAAGVTDREMTALLGGLLTLETVEKSRSTADWKASSKRKFREAGKMGRSFRPITEEDIAQAELEADPDYVDPNDDWYIADSFGTREERFGQRVSDMDEKSFNKYMKVLDARIRSKNTKPSSEDDSETNFGWIGSLLADKELPTAQTWVNKYAGSNLNFIKDLNVAYKSVTQLGAAYTGGKYENLLRDKPRKSLNDDELNLF